MSALVSELPSHPSHEMRDRQTHQGQNLQTQGTAPHRAQSSVLLLPCHPWSTGWEGAAVRANVFSQKRMQHWLCCLLGWAPSVLHHRSRQKLFKHYKPCTVLPVGRCSPAVYFVSALVNQKHLRALSCALSSLFTQGQDKLWVCTAAASPREGTTRKTSPRGELGQVGAELLHSAPWAKPLSLVSFSWALHTQCPRAQTDTTTWARTCPGTAALDVQAEPSVTCWGFSSCRELPASQQRCCRAALPGGTRIPGIWTWSSPSTAPSVWPGSPGCAARDSAPGTCFQTPKDKQNKQQGQRQPKNPAVIPVPTNLCNTGMSRGIFKRQYHVSRLGCF